MPQNMLKVNPITCVGVMVFTSSEARLFSRVVLPALSRPRSTIRTSCSVVPFSFSMTESKPCVGGGEGVMRGHVQLLEHRQHSLVY